MKDSDGFGTTLGESLVSKLPGFKFQTTTALKEAAFKKRAR